MKKFKIVSKHGKYRVFEQDGKKGLLKRVFFSSEVIIPAKTDDIICFPNFGNNVFQITVGFRKGLYDAMNKCSFVPVVFKEITFGCKDRIIVKYQDNKYKVINNKNEDIIGSSDEIFSATYQGKNCFCVKREQKYGILDFDGKIVQPFIYDAMKNILGYLLWRLNGEYVVYKDKILAKSNNELFFDEYYFYFKDGDKHCIVYEDNEAQEVFQNYECLREAMLYQYLYYPW